MTPDKPSWWQMFEPLRLDEREEHSLIGEIEPVKETAEQRATGFGKWKSGNETRWRTRSLQLGTLE
jgi:hypothetical protein